MGCHPRTQLVASQSGWDPKVRNPTRDPKVASRPEWGVVVATAVVAMAVVVAAAVVVVVCLVCVCVCGVCVCGGGVVSLA